MRIAITAAATSILLAACTSAPRGDGPSAAATLEPRSGSQVQGTVHFTQAGDRVRVTGSITGHTPGPKGLHIHDKGDCSDPKAMSAAGHFNPAKSKHGGPGEGHAGDLGNVVFDASGRATIEMTVTGITVSRDAANGIVGRGLVVHVDADDLKTDPTGNSGGRVACGDIR